MFRARYLVLTVILVVLIWIVIDKPSVSNEEAIRITKGYCQKMGVASDPWDGEPWVLARKNGMFISDKIIEVVVGKRKYFKIIATVDCVDKQVTQFINSGIKEKVFGKYKIDRDNRKPRKWPTFLPESRAKEIIFALADKIYLPKDIELSKVQINEEDGTWNAAWIRKHNGYVYEENYVCISIMAVDGEFYSYVKRFQGKPCSTEVKITKEEAIQKGWKKVSNYLDYVKLGYEVESAELKIVQPNAFFGFVLPMWKSKKSRLAWVINYAPKKPLGDSKRMETGYHDRFVIKIDADNKSFLGGVTGMYR